MQISILDFNFKFQLVRPICMSNLYVTPLNLENTRDEKEKTRMTCKVNTIYLIYIYLISNHDKGGKFIAFLDPNFPSFVASSSYGEVHLLQRWN